jgi:hypothetical protein
MEISAQWNEKERLDLVARLSERLIGRTHGSVLAIVDVIAKVASMDHEFLEARREMILDHLNL